MIKRDGIYSRDRWFALLVALVVAGFVFCPYLGQKLFSDVVTFQKARDALQQTFPAFMQAWELPIKGGVDLETFNGATEMGMRAHLAIAYPLFILFSFLGQYTSFGFAFILFFAVHMVAFIYWGILLGIEHFRLDRKWACLFTLSSLTTVLISSWYVSYYIITTLFLPTLYFSICAVKETSKSRIFLYSFGYVMSFLGGYVLLATFSCLLALVMTIAYALLWQEGNWSEKKKSILQFSLCPITSGIAVFLYYFQILLYTRNTALGGRSIFMVATDLPLIPKDLIQIASYAFTPLNPIESINTPYVGFSWLALMGVMFFCGRYKRGFSPNRRRFLTICYGIYGFQLLLAMGGSTPLQYWFYLVPAYGGMHLPIRYMLLTMPLLFLALTVSLAHQEEENHRQIYSGLLLVCTVGIFLLLFWRSLAIEADQNHLLMELILFAGFLIAARVNVTSKLCIFILIIATIFSPLQRSFYNDIRTTQSDFEVRSIVYSQPKVETLDRFIDLLPSREKYRFVSFDTNNVPEFIPSNYPWYNCSQYNLVNYMGYEFHMSVPKEYTVTWFGDIDWMYVADTRGDFAILDPAYVAENWDQLGLLVDPVYDGPYLDGNHKVYALKKFVPFHYAQEYFVVDTGSCLDNGYFYCPDLTDKNLLAFDTDDTSYFTARISSDRSTDLAMLFHPNRFYHYYLDGKEITATIENGRVYIPITSGEHLVEIRYINRFNEVSNCILEVYFASLIGVEAYWLRKRWGQKKCS